MHRTYVVAFLVAAAFAPFRVHAQEQRCRGIVFNDLDGNGLRSRGEAGIAGAKVSDGVEIAVTRHDGSYELASVAGRIVFVIKPAGYAAPKRSDGLPAFWKELAATAAHDSPSAHGAAICPDLPLTVAPPIGDSPLDVLVFSDPQPKSLTDVDYYQRDIVDPLLSARASPRSRIADLGLSLGDIVHDDLSLYPAIKRATAQLRVPWLHVPGNHDLDLQATRDEDSLQTFHEQFGPDSFAWEERQAAFVMLDDVVYQPGHKPAYIGGFRPDQFRFLKNYLPTLPHDRLLVVAVHIPLFPDGGETFRSGDRARLFELLQDFPHLLVLSGHGHVQRQFFHDTATGWHGAHALHEYNVGAACGAFWSGLKDAQGIPDATMADGTPNGYARLRVDAQGGYALSWHPARLPGNVPDFTQAMALHAPAVLRRGAYPAWGVYANVFMGRSGLRVEYRIDGGDWKPMTRVDRADPRLVAENVRDDTAPALRGFDRSPEAQISTHLWRGALPTDLSTGVHRVDVREFDPWTGVQQASTAYSLQEASP